MMTRVPRMDPRIAPTITPVLGELGSLDRSSI